MCQIVSEKIFKYT